MKKIAKFEKVSFAQFRQDWEKYDSEADEAEIRRIYEGIRLPVRATKGSAGYDFFAPVDFCLEAGKERLIPTGIRAKMDEEYVLMIFPRSGLGFKYRFQLNNTVGIIDADYYHAANEGHIMCKVINDSRENTTLAVRASTGMVQGIFLPFGITVDDEAENERTGGFGSTTEK